jgi:hypothetical protein
VHHRPLSVALCLVAVGTGSAAAAAEIVPKVADVAVNRVRFADPASAEAVLGKDLSCHATADWLDSCGYLSADLKQAWILIFHPGAMKHGVYEMIVRNAAKTDAANTILHSASFRTGKGIHLGMSREELREILGWGKASKDGGTDVVNYEIVDGGEAAPAHPFLDRYALPSYFGKYTFSNDQLVEFHFGFEYP